MSHGPKAESREPRAQSPEPRAQIAANHLPRVFHATLHGCGHRRAHHDAARTGRQVNVEGGLFRNFEISVARPGLHAPVAGRRSVDAKVAAAGAGAQASVHAAHFDVAGTGLHVDVALANVVKAQVPASRTGIERATNAASLDIPGTRMHAQVAGEIAQADIARARLEINARPHAFDGLVPGACLRSHLGIGWGCDLVVDRNVAVIHVADTDAITILLDRGIVLDGLDVCLSISRKPAIANMNASDDLDASGGSVVNGHVAGAREHFKIGRAADVQSFLKAALFGSKRRRTYQQHADCYCQGVHRSLTHGHSPDAWKRGLPRLAVIRSAATQLESCRPRVAPDTSRPSA